MATKNLQTNLKLITSVMSAAPTAAQLPLGYMAFGLVNGQASIWGNYDGTVRDLIQEGSPKVTVSQSTGTSTTDVMSQNAVSTALGGKQSVSLKNQANGYAGLDENAKLVPDVIPDYVMSKLLFGGTIDLSGDATLSEAFQSKYGFTTSITQITDDYAPNYEGVYFIAEDMSPFTNQVVLNVAGVSTGDWVISIGTKWVKIDNTDAVVSVNGKTGAVTLTLSELGGLSSTSAVSTNTVAFTAAGTRANVATGDTLATLFGKLAKWYTDLTSGLAFSTSVTSAQTPIATSSARGAVIVPVASALTVDSSGNIDVSVGDGIKKNASNQLEADVQVTYGVI
jgi:hypothetical protein